MDQVFQRVCPFSDFLLANPKRRQREKHREDLRGVQKGQIWVFLLSTIRKSFSDCCKSIHEKEVSACFTETPGIPDLIYRSSSLQSPSPAMGWKGIFLEKLLGILCLFCDWLHLLLEHRPGVAFMSHISELQRAEFFNLSGEQ